MAGDRNRIAIFYFLLANRRHQFLIVPQIICERHLQSLATDAFLRIWFFTDMDFLESFQAVALGLLSYLVMRTINHTVIFLSYFLFSSSFFMALRRSFLRFLENYKKETVWWGLYFVMPQPLEANTFLGVVFCNS